MLSRASLDVSDPCSIKESAKKVSSLLGKNGLNLLVNNAGVLTHGTMQSATDQEMHNAFNTNLMGPLTVTKVMKKRFFRCLSTKRCLLLFLTIFYFKSKNFKMKSAPSSDLDQTCTIRMPPSRSKSFVTTCLK